MADKKYDLDSAQKKAVNVSVNAVVSAGAGSGKTSVLAKRFTDILKRDPSCEVEQILTLTFTEKATVEMNGRIYKELSEACPEKAKDFYKANIRTLDSYCSQVARLGCHFYGLAPDFQIDEAKVEQMISDMAFPFILKHRDNKAVQALVDTNRFDDVSFELFVKPFVQKSSVAKKIDFRGDYEKQKNEIRAQWKKTAGNMSDLYRQLKTEVDDFQGNRSGKFFSTVSECVNDEIFEIPEIDFDESISETRKQFYETFKNICALRLPGNAKGCDEIKNCINELRKYMKIIYSYENFIFGCQYMNELIPLLEEFQQMANDAKLKSGIISFMDEASLAMNILLEHPEIRRLEKQKYKYIMIDEFQDNNQMQRDMLFLLAEKKSRNEKSVPDVSELEPDKLFFVGDEKQSIYLFRGADVSVFRALSNDFKDGNLELKTNYRSHPALIAAFNSIFGGSVYPPDSPAESICAPGVFYTESNAEQMAENNTPVPDYEAVYHTVTVPQSSKEKESEQKKDYTPRIKIAVFNKDVDIQDDELDSDTCEAVWVAQKIKELCKTKKNETEFYTPNDIAILFRSYSLLPVYERILLDEGIPFVSEITKGFFSDGPVNDIISFLRLCAYPKDRLSFVNVLRSPFANFSPYEAELVFSNFDSSKNCFEQNAENFLTEDSLSKFNFVKSLYTQVCTFLQTQPLAKIISYLWYYAGYRYETIWNKKVFMYSSMYDKLFELARQADLNSLGLAGFVDSIDTYQDEKEKLEGLKIPLESSEGVSILSVHKSKGLEYPVVFLCGAGHKSQQDSNTEAVYISKQFGITVNTPQSPLSDNGLNYFYEIQKQLSKKMRTAELRRGLYVAMTRAEQRLFVIGSYKFSEIDSGVFLPSGEKEPDSYFEILMPSISVFVEKDEEENVKIQQKNCPFVFEEIPVQKRKPAGIAVSSPAAVKEKFALLYKKAAVLEKEILSDVYLSPSDLYHGDESDEIGGGQFECGEEVSYSEIDTLVAESVSNTSFAPEFSYAQFGSVMHACMEAAVKHETFIVPNREIVGLHGNKTKIQTLEKICSDIQKKFFASPTGAKFLQAVGAKRFYRSEFSFRSLLSDKIVSGQIDLLFENEDGSFTIVDYKTDRRKKPDLYYAQLACYKQAVSKMFGIAPEKIECRLFYLRYAEDVEITKECSAVDLEKFAGHVI